MIYEEKFNDLEILLLLSLRTNRSDEEVLSLKELYARIGFQSCWNSAKQNQVAALVANTLITELPLNSVEQAWKDLLAENAKRVLSLQNSMVEISEALNSIEASYTLVENSGVMYGSNMPLQAFCAGDFDLIVDRDKWNEVQKCFVIHGFQAEDRRNRPTNRTEFCRPLPDGKKLWINPGYVPFDRMWVPLHYNDRSSVWLERRIPSEKCPSIYVLSPEDALAFVGMHTSLHSFIRAPGIRLHVDVDRIVCDNTINWKRFKEEVDALGVPTRIFVSLIMARDLLNTPIPKEVLQYLYPGLFRWKCIRKLLSYYSVFHNEKRRKLPQLAAILLDFLIDERNVFEWLYNVMVPNRQWMIEHFGGEAGSNVSTVVLHKRRVVALFKQWRPM